uniref:Uncharacterized protein n=1 Tax=Magnetococcus massalia (strain MO-1) TaxID=451514 RepID=A0A1S7LIW5_MAGMO|nr:protein of unknown function [Candidatus Magnetococcus massalia]
MSRRIDRSSPTRPNMEMGSSIRRVIDLTWFIMCNIAYKQLAHACEPSYFMQGEQKMAPGQRWQGVVSHGAVSIVALWNRPFDTATEPGGSMGPHNGYPAEKTGLASGAQEGSLNVLDS